MLILITKLGGGDVESHPVSNMTPASLTPRVNAADQGLIGLFKISLSFPIF